MTVEWLPPRKMQEWLEDRLSSGGWQRAQRELHRAVIDGRGEVVPN
jgi:hypothetical protein